MGGIGSMLGLAGGAAGTGFATPQGANLQTPVTTDQANAANQASQNALAQQQAFLQQVQAQNGLGNQTNVFNQLANVAAGKGPNPAQAQLAQATGANVANQATLMAGQRGSNANVGLIARQAAQQGAQTQQQAAGQAASLQAQQSLNALQGMGALANQQAAQQAAATGAVTGAQQSQQQALLNAIAQANNARVGIQSNINTTNAGLAGQQMQQQGNLIGNLTGGIGSALGLAEGGEVSQRRMYANGGYGETNVLPQSSGSYAPMDPNNDPFAQAAAPIVAAPAAPSAPPPAPAAGPASKTAQFHAAQSSGQTSPPLKGGAAIGNTLGKAIGTGLKSLFGSGSSQTPSSPDRSASGFTPEQMQQESMRNAAVQSGGIPAEDATGADQISQQGQTTQAPAQADQDTDVMQAAKGGKVPALLSPGERYLTPEKANKVVKGKADPIKDGKLVPGKPKVSGAVNSYKNDTVKANLDEGGIVIPRSITEGKNPHWEAMKFVHKTMAKGGKLPRKP